MVKDLPPGKKVTKGVEVLPAWADILLVKTMKLKLAQSRTGRVILHSACLLINRKKAAWHWAGIKRELLHK